MLHLDIDVIDNTIKVGQWGVFDLLNCSLIDFPFCDEQRRPDGALIIAYYN